MFHWFGDPGGEHLGVVVVPLVEKFTRPKYSPTW